MSEFDKPADVSRIDSIFGRIDGLMPSYQDIPDEYKGGHHPAIKFQQKWFFEGLEQSDIPPVREGIDRNAALMHLKAVQSSFEPKHEHKEAAVAYLADKWFDFEMARKFSPCSTTPT